MRTLIFCLTFFAFMAMGAEAQADRIQLPCDGGLALTAGSDLTSARTEADKLGDIAITRFTPFSLGLEAAIIDACVSRKTGRTSRAWLGRLSVNGGLSIEETSYGIRRTLLPVMNATGQTVLDDQGNAKREDGLSAAELKGDNYSWSAGLRLALLDLPHFHLEAYASAAGSLGWTATRTESATAHAFDRNLEVGWYLADNVSMQHRWRLLNAGITMGSPWRIRPSFRLTPEITMGYARLDVAARYELSSEIKSVLAFAGHDPSEAPARFDARKVSPVAHVGLRADFHRALSFDLAAMFAKSGCYWMAVSAVFRFDAPWHS